MVWSSEHPRLLPAATEGPSLPWTGVPGSSNRAFDADLLALDEADRAPDESLSVLFTHSRCEKRVARACERLEIPLYLPLREGRRMKRGERFTLPLFPGYVFVSLSARSRRGLREVVRVVRVLPVPRPEELLTELRQIDRALAVKPNLSAAPALARGRRVEVVGGPFAGVVGVIADRRVRRSRLHLVLNVTMLGQSAVVQIDAGDVELLPGPPAVVGPEGAGGGQRGRRRRGPAGGGSGTGRAGARNGAVRL
jgi:transcription antitermination factor NusG